MKLTKKKVWFTTLCFIILSTAVTASMNENKMKEDESAMMEKSHQSDMAAMNQSCHIDGRADTLQSVDDIMGMVVKNKQGEMLGIIEDLMMDRNEQIVRYVILSTANHHYPIPWTAFDTGTETYTLDISRNKLMSAPIISSIADTGQFSQSEFQKRSHDYYNEQISAVQDKNIGQRVVDWMKKKTTQMLTEEQSPEFYAVNTIIGADVRNTQNQSLGLLNDVVFDIRQGNLAYGLINFGGFSGIAEKTAAVPWESIKLQPGLETARLDADESTLQNSILPDGNLQLLSQPAFARQIHQGFNQEPYWEVFGFIEPTGGSAGMITGATWRQESLFNSRFDTNSVQTMNATVKKISTFSPEKNASPGLKLKVQTDEGQTLNIYAGPEQYYLQQPVRFQRGDRITVTGSQTIVNEKSIIMACEITKGKQSLMLRDSQGKPLWKVERTESERMSP